MIGIDWFQVRNSLTWWAPAVVVGHEAGLRLSSELPFSATLKDASLSWRCVQTSRAPSHGKKCLGDNPEVRLVGFDVSSLKFHASKGNYGVSVTVTGSRRNKDIKARRFPLLDPQQKQLSKALEASPDSPTNSPRASQLFSLIYTLPTLLGRHEPS